MASSTSSLSHPRPNRRQPTSFLGGPFLVNQLHSLPPSLVDLVFTFPSTNPSFNHSDLVKKGIEVLIFAAETISKEKFSDWSVGQRKTVVDLSLRHSRLRELSFTWALDERARDQGPFDESTEKLESLLLAVAGGISTHLGDGEAVQWLRVVLDEPFEESVRKVEEKEEKLRLKSIARPPTPPSAHLSPPTPLIPLQPQPVEEPPQQPPPPTTTFTLVRDAIQSLPPHERNTIFTHPSTNPTDNLDLLVPSGLAFLRSVVHTILLRNAPVQLDPERIEVGLSLPLSFPPLSLTTQTPP
ncbi:hypothetical protein BDY24DRAFT_390728 [Mrakia frigida]|uniref:uncharacterized protein n=1 Tax=Mrakia frigida TaxID=29902 RepID=UPI003FCC0253